MTTIKVKNERMEKQKTTTDDFLKNLLKENSNKQDSKKSNTVNIKGLNINISTLDIKFKLNDQQVEALNQLADFLDPKNPERAFTLSGFAGTGKSSIVKILLKYVSMKFGYNYHYEITAPTNRAKYVIESLSGRRSQTIHKLLGIRPDLDIEKLDLKTLKFGSKGVPSMPKDLLLIDECSLCNDVLTEDIIKKATTSNCKVIFIGDVGQLKPVGQNDVSLTFKIPTTYQLTKVERQKDSNPIGRVLDSVRNNPFADEPAFNFNTQITDEGEGIEFIDTSSDFIEKAFESLKSVVFYTDYLHARIVTFQNKRTQLYNKLIRSKLGFDGEYHKGELLMAYDNVGRSDFEEGLINSCDYIIENDPVLESRVILGHLVAGYRVNLVSTDERSRLSQFILSRSNSQESLENVAFAIEDLRISAVNEKDRFRRSSLWKEYYAETGSFLTPEPLTVEGRYVKSKSIDFGYSMTCHKSQGGTFTEVFVDFRDFQSCFDVQQRNQLIYVGLSRCSKKATLFV